MKFSVGDRVTNRKLGPIIIGEVIGFLPGDYYISEVGWYDTYPYWRCDYVYYIKLDKMLGEHDCLIFPEEDLILLGDLNDDESLS